MSKSDPGMLRIECFNCSKIMRASEDLRGQIGHCPRCGNRIHIPEADPQPPSVTPESPEPETDPPTE